MERSIGQHGVIEARVCRSVQRISELEPARSVWSGRSTLVAVMQPAEDGQRNDLAHLQRLHRPWDRRVLAEREVRSGRVVVVVEVLSQDASEMQLAEHDDVVEALSADGPDQPLDVWALPRTSRRDEHFIDPHRLDALAEHVGVDAVAIADHVAARRVPGEGLGDLSCRPFGGWIRGHVEVEDPPAVVRQDQEDVQDAQPDRGDGEEVDRGHQSVETTRKVYARISGRFSSEQMAKVGEFMRAKQAERQEALPSMPAALREVVAGATNRCDQDATRCYQTPETPKALRN